MSRELDEFRATAVAQAGGSSGDAIRGLVLRMLDDLAVPESLLDVGAGKGDLLRSLRSRLPDARLAGSDYLPRPAGLHDSIEWFRRDFNNQPLADEQYDVIICSEVIEHLENPRQLMRALAKRLTPGGALILTTPNQESIRSYVALLVRGHFAAFQSASYPAHLTALLRVDLRRILSEAGFDAPTFAYSESGGIPGAPHRTWQHLTLSLLCGRLFSDNIGLTAFRV